MMGHSCRRGGRRRRQLLMCQHRHHLAQAHHLLVDFVHVTPQTLQLVWQLLHRRDRRRCRQGRQCALVWKGIHLGTVPNREFRLYDYDFDYG